MSPEWDLTCKCSKFSLLTGESIIYRQRGENPCFVFPSYVFFLNKIWTPSSNKLFCPSYNSPCYSSSHPGKVSKAVWYNVTYGLSLNGLNIAREKVVHQTCFQTNLCSLHARADWCSIFANFFFPLTNALSTFVSFHILLLLSIC